MWTLGILLMSKIKGYDRIVICEWPTNYTQVEEGRAMQTRVQTQGKFDATSGHVQRPIASTRPYKVCTITKTVGDVLLYN